MVVAQVHLALELQFWPGEGKYQLGYKFEKKGIIYQVGSNDSVTVANRLEEAQRLPERYDLVRNRMGGWSEFFVAMFPHLQETTA
jgi:hypothetical protein